MKRLLAEALGTFCVVFAGTGAIVVNHQSGGVIGHAGIAVTFGLVVMAMILALGPISGAHMNPAVSLALALARRFPARDVPGFAIAQLAGAFAASVLLRVLFATSPTLGETLPAGPAWQSFVLEIVLTFVLMLVVFGVSTRAQRSQPAALPVAAVAVGGVVALEAMFAGPICGASMNPARSLAPAVVSGKLQSLWVYLTAPVLGAAMAVPAAHALGLLAPRQATRGTGEASDAKARDGNPSSR
jgi:aquaporin Z